MRASFTIWFQLLLGLFEQDTSRPFSPSPLHKSSFCFFDAVRSYTKRYSAKKGCQPLFRIIHSLSFFLFLQPPLVFLHLPLTLGLLRAGSSSTARTNSCSAIWSSFSPDSACLFYSHHLRAEIPSHLLDEPLSFSLTGLARFCCFFRSPHLFFPFFRRRS